MKAAEFQLYRPKRLAEVGELLLRHAQAQVMAGGQSLGPMLNLRLARPPHVVLIGHLAELCAVEETDAAITIGACVTDAAIQDGRVPDIGGALLARIAGGIGCRAVRNRGTIGGSLCHADPAADWLCVLTALGGVALTWRSNGGRAIPLESFVSGPFRTTLQPREILQAVRIPRASPAARFGYYKACRKPGAYAHAMVAVFEDPDRALRRAVIGAVGGAPVVLDGPQATAEAAERALRQTGLGAVECHLQLVAFRRACEGAASWHPSRSR